MRTMKELLASNFLWLSPYPMIVSSIIFQFTCSFFQYVIAIDPTCMMVYSVGYHSHLELGEFIVHRILRMITFIIQSCSL